MVSTNDFRDGKYVFHKYLVPVEEMEVVNRESIFLKRNGPPLNTFPAFELSDYPLAPLDWQPPYPYSVGMVRWQREQHEKAMSELNSELIISYAWIGSKLSKRKESMRYKMNRSKIPTDNGKKDNEDKNKQELREKQARAWISYFLVNLLVLWLFQQFILQTFGYSRNANPVQRVQIQDLGW